MSSARLEEMLADAGLAPAEQAELSELLAAARRDHRARSRAQCRAGRAVRRARRGRRPRRAGPPRPRRPAVARAHSDGRSRRAGRLQRRCHRPVGRGELASRVRSSTTCRSSRSTTSPSTSPSPEETDQPLGQGRFALVPGDLPPTRGRRALECRRWRRRHRASAGSSWAPIARPRQVRSSSRPRRTSADPQQVRTSGHQGHPVPSAAPSPTASASPSASPSPSADERRAGGSTSRAGG